MNTFIQDFRKQNPNFPGSDEELTLKYGDTYPPDQFEYPEDFVADYQRLKTARDVEASSVTGEFGKALSRGVSGLETSTAGALALGAGLLGADRIKGSLLDYYRTKTQQTAEESPPSVPTIQGVRSLPALGQYVAGKVGEFVPAAGEAVALSLAGSAVAPGPGTVGGIFARGALRAALKKTVEQGLKAEVRKELEDFAAGKIAADVLSKEALGTIAKASQLRAATAATAAGFGVGGAGGAYGELSGTPGVSESDARTGALIAGAGASLGALIPARVLRGIFGDDIPPSSYIDLFAKKVPAELLTAGGGLGAMEFFNILAEHYADPNKRDKEFSKDDYSRLLNAVAAGFIAGTPAAGISAFRGVRPPEAAKVPPEEAPPPAAAPEAPPPGAAPKGPVTPGSPVPGAGLAGNYPVPPDQLPNLRLLAQSEVSGNINPEEVEAFLAKNPGLRLGYEQIKAEVANATQAGKKQENIQQQRQRADEELQKAAPDRNVPSVVEEKGAQAGAGDSLQQAAGELSEEKKAALKLAGIDPEFLGAGLRTEEFREPMPSPVDKTIAAARAKALEAREAVRENVRKAQAEAGWDPKWPFVPADLMNADFRDLISKDPSLSESEKDRIFSAGEKLGVVPKGEVVRLKIETKPKAPEPPAEPPGLTDEQIANRKALFQVSGMTPEEFVKTLGKLDDGTADAAVAHSDLMEWLISREQNLPEGVEAGDTSPEGLKAFQNYIATARRLEAIAPRSIHEFMDQLGIAEKDRPWKRPAKKEPVKPAAETEAKTPAASEPAKPKPKEVIKDAEEIKTQKEGDEGVLKQPEAAAAIPGAAAAPSDTDILNEVGRVMDDSKTVTLHKDVVIDRVASRLEITRDEVSAALSRLNSDGKLGLDKKAPFQVRLYGATPISETSWLSNVVQKITAWMEPRPGKAEEDMYSNLGRDPKNKSKTRALGVFRGPSGKVIVASIYDNNGKKVFIGNKGRSWKRTTEGGGAETKFTPIGYIKTQEAQEKFYREYTPEQWEDIQRQLEAKRNAAAAEVSAQPPPVTPAAAAEAGLKPEGKPAEIAGKGSITKEDAATIKNLVIEEVGGFPKSEDVPEFVSNALLRDPDLQARLREIAGQSKDAFGRLMDRIFSVYERAAESGETDLNILTKRITGELEGLDARKGKEPSKPGEAAPGGVPKPTEPGPGEKGYLASSGIGKDKDPSPQGQAFVRDVLSRTKSAHEALIQLFRAGVYGDDPIVKDLIELGDHGTRVALAPGDRETSGRYSPKSHVAYVYDAAFQDGNAARSFLHEYVHGNTVFQIETGRNRGELTFLHEMAREAAAKQKKEFYGLTNQAEFIAEAFSDSDFQNFLRSIPATGIKETLWSRFVKWVGSLIGIKPENLTLLDEVLSVGQRISGKYEPIPTPVQVPDSSRTVQWHNPVNGDKGTIQTYNPTTGRIEYAPLIQDSVEAALQNVTQEPRPPEYLLPSAAAYEMVDPEARMTNEHAINNKQEEVLKRGADDAGVTLDVARTINGLHSTQTVRERLAFEEGAKGIQNVNRAQTLEALKHPVNRNYVATGILGALDKAKSKIASVLAKAKENLPKFQAEHERRLADHSEILDNLEDANFMGRQIRNGVIGTITDSLKAAARTAEEMGAAYQMFQDIEGRIDRPIDPETVNIFRRLSTSDALTGEKLFNLLDQMANDPSLDFGQKASDIRNYIRHAAEMDPSLHRYAQLSADDPATKALLSTVIAYGKLNRRTLTMLEVRKMDGPDRLALKQELKDQLNEATGQIKTGVRRVAKSSALIERARAENRESLRAILDNKRKMEHAQKVISINEKLLPHYDNEIDKITPLIQQTEDTVFGDGMVIRVPKTNELHPAWEEMRLNLRTTSKNPTTVAELKSAFDKMTAWTKLRENDYAAGNELALGLDYRRVKQQIWAIGKQKLGDPVLRATDHTLTGLFMGSNAKAMGALGTPVGKLIETAMNKFAGDTTNLRNASDKEFGYKNQRLFNKVLSVLNNGQPWWRRKKVSSDWFESKMLNAALGFLERGQPSETQELEVARNQWFQKMGQWLLSDPDIKPVIQDRMPQFMAAMRELADSVYSSGQWWVRKNQEAGLLVKDPSLGEGRLRKHIEQGLWTFQRKFSDTFFATIHALRGSLWAEDADNKIPGAYKDWQNFSAIYSQDPAAGEALVSKYTDNPTHGDTVKKDFLYKITHVPDGSVIRTPALDESGTKIPVDPAVLAEAYDNSGGNLIQMALRLHDYYNGQDARADYIQDVLLDLARTFKSLDAALKKVEPQSPTKITTFVGLVPSAMIDARELQHLPPDWFNYHRFDNNDNARIAERTAWQINMGREGRELANWHETASNDAKSLIYKLDSVLKQASDAVPSGRRREIDREAARRLAADPDPLLAQFKTGEERLKFLRKTEERYPFIQSLLRDMNTFFQRGTDSAGSLRWGIRMAGELASLLVNQPSAAIAQLATTVDIMVQWGLSPTTLKATARTIQVTGKDIAGSLAQGIGWEFLKPSYYEQRAFKLGLLSPLAARRMGDILGDLTGEESNRAAKFWRIAKEAQGFTLNLRGEKAQYTPLQPFSPFFQFVTAANRGLLISLAEMADGYVSKGVEFLRTHPGAEKITAEDLGLNRFDRNSFEIWKKDHARYGLDFDDMVRGAKERMDSGDRTVITDKELAQINAVALNVISLESNIATMPLWAFNNSVVRFGLPLLGWSYRRAGQLAGARLNTKDQMSLYAVSNALLGVAATGLGGLGISLIVDAYSEDVLGKKRNIRSLRVPTTTADWQGIEERMAKVGTFGLWGELVNSAWNVGTGQGDNRMLSVDQRVVAMQSFQSLFKAISAYINQGFDADYRNVVRPMVGAIGGSGMLQYAQIVNHAFDLDNVEARVVKRINAENYLRVVGRDLGMNVRSGGGAYNTPTPITPWIARMELAAYANDPSAFRAAFNGAREEAKLAGKPDPQDYVKKAFETRHPLRYVFGQVPSEREYRQILANLDDNGRDSVTEAIRLFNHYGEYLGLVPFQGSVKKDQQRSWTGDRAIQARLMAIGANP